MTAPDYQRQLAAATTPAQVLNCLQGALPFVECDHETREALVGATVARLDGFDPEGGTRGCATVVEVAA